jgi:hypothetical protein
MCNILRNQLHTLAQKMRPATPLGASRTVYVEHAPLTRVIVPAVLIKEVEPHRLFPRDARRSCYFVEPLFDTGVTDAHGLDGVGRGRFRHRPPRVCRGGRRCRALGGEIVRATPSDSAANDGNREGL